MIIDTLQNADRYAALHVGFAEAFTFLRRQDLRDLAVDRYSIDGDRVYAMVARDQGRDKAGAQLEVHDKYIDIQMVLSGCDEMGWRPRSLCRQPAGLVEPERDIRFFADPPVSWLPVEPGIFVIFFPEDAHLPMISSGLLHKVIVKVAAGKS